MIDLTNKVAIVTGGAQNIGAAIADSLASAGAKVVVADLKDSPAHASMKLDVSVEADVEQVINEVVKEHGSLDIVVNNAGVMFENPIGSQDLDSWNKMIAINLTGPMLMCKFAAPHLAKSGSGAIVNIGSIEGDYCNPHHAAYAATKAGVHGLTRAVAIDLGPQGIRCNAIAPGWIDTELNASYVDSHPDRAQVVAELAKLHPIGRIGAPGDVGAVAVWLASDQAQFVTGQVITVDGGRTSRPPLPSILS